MFLSRAGGTLKWRRFASACATALALLAIACGADAGEGTEPDTTATALAQPTSSAPGPDTPAGRLAESGRPRSWVYWISDVDLDAIAEARPPLAVIDYSRDGSGDEVFTREQIDGLRESMAAPGLVLAYMSIGEAEDYRYYWRPEWEQGSPMWLEDENPDWPGNYAVRYWEPEWQSIIFGGPDAYLDRILSAGFDGVYLDIVDAYERYTEMGISNAEDEMVEFVRAISAYAKERSPGFLVFHQNAPELGRRGDLLGAVDGIGMEGTYFGWDAPNRPTPPEVTDRLEDDLAQYVGSGLLVLTADYVDGGEDLVRMAYRRARFNDFVPTVTNVELNGLPVREPPRQGGR